MLRATLSLLASRILLAFAFVTAQELLLMPFGDDGLREAVESGIAGGLGGGIALFVLALWARKYRASVDLAERALHRPEPGQSAEGLPSWRRYYSGIYLWIVAYVGLSPTVAMAIGAVVFRAGPVLTIISWAMVPLAGYYLWTLLTTYVDIGLAGILVRQHRKSRFIVWDDLVDVLWEREPWADYPSFGVADGTRVKAPFGVANNGSGEKRMLRMLRDVELAWRWRLRVQASDPEDRRPAN